MKAIGIDYGEVRIGIAMSDPLGMIASGVGTFQRKTDEQLIRDIAELCKKENVNRVVLGYPLNMNGTEGKKALEVKSFKESLEKSISIPVILWDERLTTAAVNRVMISASASRRKRREKSDKLAAQLILQGYLDSVRIGDSDDEAEIE